MCNGYGIVNELALCVQEMGTKILQAALALHEKVAGTFRKTAVNFHYEFTVRHLANVFQGLLMSTPEQFNNVTKLSRLWLHESERVYADRLVSAAVSFCSIVNTNFKDVSFCSTCSHVKLTNDASMAHSVHSVFSAIQRHSACTLDICEQ